ncbi:hypothetical protein C671_2292 [[Clostridium] bifermentans ATCC 19299]|uniref:hypothetical protein n=1 Tax=Paraclostridium bifermentans TaxID=1490 RepID=UPI00038D7243|nr:hypothetical protein [Paraclostridium bifermentans]EQK44949.1 hypothetical protein C671_2292 [[Clostridium] bifermentans ATCC 19299] [Paraclostridium bifermentans ATCC 19299]
MKESTKKLICELHLYKLKIEAFIKVTIWTISWIGGIYVLQGITEKETIGSAYLVFSLSLLMEFCLDISKQTMIISKISRIIFCGLCVIMLVISLIVLVDAPIKPFHYNTLYYIPKIIMGWMWIDTIALCIGEEIIDSNRTPRPSNKPSDEDKKIEKEFTDKLTKGALGNT